MVLESSGKSWIRQRYLLIPYYDLPLIITPVTTGGPLSVHICNLYANSDIMHYVATQFAVEPTKGY